MQWPKTADVRKPVGRRSGTAAGLRVYLSHVIVKVGRMELQRNVFSCERCRSAFPRRCRSGRKPLYCSVSCRQRAYEARRRGALQIGLPAPPPRWPKSPKSPGYVGGHGPRRKIHHALRPSGVPNGRRLATLCGTWAFDSGYRFGLPQRRAKTCQTCSRIAQLGPVPRWIDSHLELPAVSALAARLIAPLTAKDDLALRTAAADLTAVLVQPAA